MSGPQWPRSARLGRDQLGAAVAAHVVEAVRARRRRRARRARTRRRRRRAGRSPGSATSSARGRRHPLAGEDPLALARPTRRRRGSSAGSGQANVAPESVAERSRMRHDVTSGRRVAGSSCGSRAPTARRLCADAVPAGRRRAVAGARRGAAVPRCTTSRRRTPTTTRELADGRVRRVPASICAAPARPAASPPTSTPTSSGPTCATVIAWLAAQPWCTGRVGMFGTSYSGSTRCTWPPKACPSSARSSPSTPPTTATPTTSTTAAACCGRSTSSTTSRTWWR